MPAVVLSTPAGTASIYSPVEPLSPLAVPEPPFDASGTYSGVARPLSTAGGLCIRPIPVSGFHVTGNTVQFGGFRGAIDAQHGLQMTFGGQWIVGQFEELRFDGQIDVPGPGRFGLGCSYAMTLRRISP